MTPNEETVSTIDIRSFLKHNIQTNFKPGNKFTVQFSFVDLRMINLKRKIKHFSEDREQKFEKINELELASIINTVVKDDL